MSTFPLYTNLPTSCHNQQHDDHHDDHHEILNAIHDVSTATLQNNANSTASVIAANERIAFSTKDSLDKQAIANREAIERTGIASTTSTERNGQANLTSTERNGSAVNLSVERNGGDIRHGMQQIAGETRSLMYQQNTQSLLSAKDILLEMAKNTCHLERQASDNYSNIQLEACKNKASLEFEAAKNKASLELEALKNKEALSAQLAHCCCEIKESIISSSGTTQLLIRDIESNRVRDALNASTTENLILRLGGNSNGNNRT